MARWIYTMDGKRAYYQEGNDIYEPGGSRPFWVSGKWWTSRGEKPRYYIDGDHVYEAGRTVFYYAKQ